ncbi:SDR family oxidoreductase [Rhodococcus sp. SORGH_AS_0303]|uniref:SDR family oxidoreductase n=1 Tax=Rhodococcus sp. SORGH_AS_0303 TaxID=3041753 RepID=UPI00278577C2|nr:SDR family oxidoreductase [Rhodococcus sp. SORGH_AS_0303]MDQ1203331.1 NAD(P)-dependent dehydrogenase (short-subunit alcohol dehydrogenase family) [Rhodococcus sp. SORGH_AS_0303]
MTTPGSDFVPRTAVVTGGDSGIGRAVAVALAGGGLDVGVTYNRDREGAEATVAEIRALGCSGFSAHMDLTDLPGAPFAVDSLASELGGIDVLVNCSGTGTATSFLDLDFDSWRTVLSVDVDGAFLCGQHAARLMVEQGHGGRIVNVTSVHEHLPKVGAAPYCAAKAGLGGLTQVMAIELAQYGITVNSVAPGEISTPMTGQTDENPENNPRPGVPLGRTGDAREIASVVAFLAGPTSSYMTGASLVVDGGMALMGPQAVQFVKDDAWRSV